MKNQIKENELQNLINKLLQNIAQINTLFPDSWKIGDFITVEDKKLGPVTFGVSRKILGQDDSWILASRDEPLWNETIAKLKELNPKIVSAHYVEQELDDLICKCKSAGWQFSHILKYIVELINGITSKKAELIRMYLPIYGLIVKVSSFITGDVEFAPRRNYPKLDEQLKDLENTSKVEGSIGRIQTVAATTATGGDYGMILEDAVVKVNSALNMIRAFRYPIITDYGLKQIGIMGTYYTLPKLFASEADQNNQNGLSAELCEISLSGVVDIIIDNYATQIMFKKVGFYRLSDLLISRISKFERRLLIGAELLGEATKPDTIEFKFLKVALAIDSMIGSEPSENIPDKGIRARIAERAAFLLADEYTERRRIYDDISGFIKKRNKLAHGAPESVSQWEAEKFGSYARNILIKLLLNDPSFKTIDDLEKWTLQKSFQG
jgi:hypothetical protein